MSKTSLHSFELGRARSFTSMIDKFVIIPILACAYAEMISPLLLYADTGPIEGVATVVQRQIIMAPRLEHKIFWPALAAISVIFAVRNWSKLTLPPHILCLFVYL